VRSVLPDLRHKNISALAIISSYRIKFQKNDYISHHGLINHLQIIRVDKHVFLFRPSSENTAKIAVFNYGLLE
jgi:hypothetical protein